MGHDHEISGKFFGSYKGEYFDIGPFDSRRECLDSMVAELDKWDSQGITKVYTGILHQYAPSIFADAVLEMVKEQAYEQCGDASESFLDDVHESQLVELNTELNAVLQSWISRHRFEPRFGIIEEIEEHGVAPHQDHDPSPSIDKTEAIAVGEAV